MIPQTVNPTAVQGGRCGPYTGPAGVILSPGDCLQVWALLELHPTADNQELRHRLKRYLEDAPTA